MPRDAILVPLKKFDVAKKRLRQGGTLEVSAMARELAEESCAAARPAQ